MTGLRDAVSGCLGPDVPCCADIPDAGLADWGSLRLAGAV